MWCITDLWRAAGAPSDKRPAEYLRKEGASFAEFLSVSLDVAPGHIKKTRKIGGGGGETWTHWLLARDVDACSGAMSSPRSEAVEPTAPDASKDDANLDSSRDVTHTNDIANARRP